MRLEGKMIMIKKQKINYSEWAQKYALLGIILVLTVIFAVLNPIFIAPANLLNIIRQAAVMIIFAVGMTYVMISGMIDLSMAGVATLTAMIAARILVAGQGLVTATLGAFAVGILFGILNGILVTKFKLNAMIVTLATNNLASGATLLICNGTAVYNLPDFFMALGRGYVGVIPIQVLIMAVVVLSGHIILKKTVYGRRVYAVGGNATVARLSGIAIESSRLSYFIISSICATLAGLILAARNATAQPVPSSTIGMDVIAATVIGGTSLSGGKGGVIGSVMGAVLLTMISNGLTVNGVSSYWQTVISAGILIVTIIIYRDE